MGSFAPSRKGRKGSEAAAAPTISPKQQDRIIRNLFLLVADERDSLCPGCGEALAFRIDAACQSGRVQVACPNCGSGFEWRQSNPSRPFKALHLQYFVERHGQGLPLRCPIDDSSITAREYSGGVVEFRCPYCNRQARTDQQEPTIGNQLLQLT